MTNQHYLYVSRTFAESQDIRAVDAMIVGVVQQMHEGAEQIGSGSGCGTRDLDFLTEDELTYEQLEELKAKILETTGIASEEVDILFETYDESGENLIEGIMTE